MDLRGRRVRSSWRSPILYDHLGDKDRAIRLSEPFMKTVVAELDNDWTLSSGEIDAFVRNHPA